MNDLNYPDNNKEQIEKAKKNLVYVGILSVVMFFGGLTSAYIVSMGDSFWLKAPLPEAFYISTAIILLSSVFIQLAVNGAKKDKRTMLLTGVTMTFILGIGFVYFQFKGYGQLIDRGIHAANNHLIVTDGRYGDYFEVKMDGKYIEVDGNDYLLAGKKMSSGEMTDFKSYMSQFLELKTTEGFTIKNDPRFILFYQSKPTHVAQGKLLMPDSLEMQYVDRLRLRNLAVNVKDERGDFFVRGKIGEDFKIYYKGEELQYENRTLHLGGAKLTNYLQIKSMEAPDTSSSYLYIITFAHLLHILFTLFFMLRLVIRSFSGNINSNNYISLRMGATFWHFLGILWIYLLLFLLFIH